MRKYNPEEYKNNIEHRRAKNRASYRRNASKRKKSALRWQKENPEKRAAIKRRHDVLRKYGLTIAEYDILLTAQGGGCAICGSTSEDQHGKPLAVDHCHRTNIVRGILCDHCNRALGMLKEKISSMLAMVRYIEKHNAIRLG